MMKNKGITLVALVITIIILLILAGISIATLTNSGLFEKARLAEQKSKEAQEKEAQEIEKYTNIIDETVNGGRGEYEDGYKKGQESAKIVRQVIKTFKYSGHDVAENWADSEDPLYGYGIKSIDVTQIPNYERLTKDNFCIELNTIEVAFGGTTAINNAGVTATIVSYEDGILTIDIPRHVRENYKATVHLGISIVAYYIDYE